MKQKVTYQLTDNNGWVLGKPGTRASVLKQAASYDADYGSVWLEEVGGAVIEELWCGKPAPSSGKFAALIDTIECKKLRENIENSALENANDTMVELGKTADRGCAFWDSAIETAKLIMDDPGSYYPELFR